jgi:transforming growth factor-beta-induced protein
MTNQTKIIISIAAVAVIIIAGFSINAAINNNSSDNNSSSSNTSTPNPVEKAETKDIVDTAVAAGNFTSLAAALTSADLITTLKGPGPFTVFAPTDAAFAKLPAATVNALLTDPAQKAELTKILTYHVVAGKVPASDVVNLSSAKTVEGSDVKITVTNGEVFLNDTVKVITTDIQASNGIIHVIDTVLIPAAPKDIVDTAVAAGNFTSLAAALQAADLVTTLKGPGPFTVFAPTDAAFAKLPAATVNALLTDPAQKAELIKILTYHAVAGKVPASEVVKLTNAKTVQGGDVKITVRNGEVFLNDTVKVITTDIQASNGIIHVIDTVLTPAS